MIKKIFVVSSLMIVLMIVSLISIVKSDTTFFDDENDVFIFANPVTSSNLNIGGGESSSSSCPISYTMIDGKCKKISAIKDESPPQNFTNHPIEKPKEKKRLFWIDLLGVLIILTVMFVLYFLKRKNY